MANKKLIALVCFGTLVLSGCAVLDTNDPWFGGHYWDTEWTNDETNHWHACLDSGYENLRKDNEEHVFDEGVVLTPVTCDDDGETKFTCTVCGYEKIVSYTALGHEKATTWSYDDFNHWKTCLHEGCDSTFDFGAHDWDEGVVTTPKTCTSDGVKTFTCNVCGKTRTQAIPMSHDPVDNLYHVKEFADGVATVGYFCGTCHEYYETMEVTAPTSFDKDIDGGFAGLADYIEVKTDVVAAYPFAWDAGENGFKSSNYHVGNSKSSISFKWKVAGTLTFNLDLSSEGSSYDYASGSSSAASEIAHEIKVNDAVVTSYRSYPEYGYGSTTPYNKTITIVADAGYEWTLTYQKDSSGDKNADRVLITNAKFGCDAFAAEAELKAVTFNTNGGSVVPPVAVAKGGKISAPANPTKDGFAFRDWYADEALTVKFDFANTAINEDTMLYAMWVFPATITVHPNNGDDAYEVVIPNGDPFVIDNPTPAEGYKFVGWYTTETFDEGTEFVSGTVADDDFDIYAKYILLNTFETADELTTAPYEGVVTTSAKEPSYFIKFVAPATDTYYFYVKDIVVGADSPKTYTGYQCIVLLDEHADVIADGTSKSYNEMINDMAGKFYASQKLIRINLEAGETVYARINGSYYASYTIYGDITWGVTTIAHDDFANPDTIEMGVAKDIAFDLRATTNVGNLYKFVPTTSSVALNYEAVGESIHAYYRVYNADKTQVISKTISSTNTGTVYIDGLTVGADYYLMLSTGRKVSDFESLSVTLSAPNAGYAYDNPITGALILDGDPIDVTRLYMPTTFYELVVAEDTNVTITTDGGYGYTKKKVTLIKDGLIVDSKVGTATDGTTDFNFADVKAGTYIVEVGYDSTTATSVAAEYDFTVKATSTVTGTTRVFPIITEADDKLILPTSVDGIWYQIIISNYNAVNTLKLISKDAISAVFYEGDNTTPMDTIGPDGTVSFVPKSGTTYKVFVSGADSTAVILTTYQELPPDGTSREKAIPFVAGEDGRMDCKQYCESSYVTRYFKVDLEPGIYAIYTSVTPTGDPENFYIYQGLDGKSLSLLVNKADVGEANVNTGDYVGTSYRFDLYAKFEIKEAGTYYFSMRLPFASCTTFHIGLRTIAE